LHFIANTFLTNQQIVRSYRYRFSYWKSR
jgi:hypothetical protein